MSGLEHHSATSNQQRAGQRMALHVVTDSFMSRDVWNWDSNHPCQHTGMGWPPDSLLHKNMRTVWVAHYAGVLCATGHGLATRGVRTQRLIIDGLRDASKLQPIPSFVAVRIGVNDAHCNETSLAYATYGLHGQNCLARLIPSEQFAVGRESSDAALIQPVGVQTFDQIVSPLSNLAATHQSINPRCGWIGRSLSDSQGGWAYG